MIATLVERLGRRLGDDAYGPFGFGEHATVYVGRRWSWRGRKSSWRGRTWHEQLPVWVTVLRHGLRLSVVKLEIGSLLVCWDRIPLYPRSGR